MAITLVLHIVAGAIGLLVGYVALFAPKGRDLHRRSGRSFLYAMLAMCATGGTIAAVRGVAPAINVPAALLTAYLAVTAVTTLRPAGPSRPFHLALLTVAFGVGATDLLFGFQAIAAGGTREGMPAFPFFLFGVVGMLAAFGDLRLLRSGPPRGAARLRRHLWRICFALFVAALSFFIGQAKVIPNALRIPALQALPILVVLAAMLFWLWRLRRRRRPIELPGLGSPAAPPDPPASNAPVSDPVFS